MPDSEITLAQPSVRESYANTDQVLITITEDKLSNILGNYTRELEQQRPLLPILAFLLSLVGLTLTVPDPDYKFLIRVSQEEWRTIWVMGALFAGGWLVWAAYRQWWQGQKKTVNEVIREIRGQSGTA